MLFDCPARCAPTALADLAQWIEARVREPSSTWRKRSPLAALLPTPVNLPGMDRAAAAVVAKYAFMPVEWRADVIQDFMAGWLLRPETAQTIARSALAGFERRNVATIEAGIAWKLRMEILSRAHREFERERRRQARDLVLLRGLRVRGTTNAITTKGRVMTSDTDLQPLAAAFERARIPLRIAAEPFVRGVMDSRIVQMDISRRRRRGRVGEEIRLWPGGR